MIEKQRFLLLPSKWQSPWCVLSLKVDKKSIHWFGSFESKSFRTISSVYSGHDPFQTTRQLKLQNAFDSCRIYGHSHKHFDGVNVNYLFDTQIFWMQSFREKKGTILCAHYDNLQSTDWRLRVDQQQKFTRRDSLRAWNCALCCNSTCCSTTASEMFEDHLHPFLAEDQHYLNQVYEYGIQEKLIISSLLQIGIK